VHENAHRPRPRAHHLCARAALSRAFGAYMAVDLASVRSAKYVVVRETGRASRAFALKLPVMSIDSAHIRNFSIIAHIDHGKSTISDRVLEMTGTVASRDMQEQILDSMDIERERGITIKSQAVRVDYRSDDGETYHFNLIDTPGHVDFTYEVSRSLAACEGAVLVVDATQGVEAQTVANAMLAMNANLEIVPLVNKIDLPSAEPERVKAEIEDALAISADDAVLASGKTGEGIRDLLEAIVYNVPAPAGDPDAPLRALIFDSYFDAYRGVVALVRIVDGTLSKGERIKLMATGCEALVEDVGVRRPAEISTDELGVGEVGYLVTGLKDPSMVKTGDTVTLAKGGVDQPLPGYRDVKPMVYTGLYPIDSDDYADLRDALEKLALNDPALVYDPETSHALGFGFRVGFLGLLHMEVVKERLEREFNLDLLATAPSVEYHVFKTDGTMISLHSPQDMPDPGEIEHVEEPFLKAKILVPPAYVGAVMDLTVGRRGAFVNMNYLSQTTVEMTWDMPLSEMIMDYFDKLKSSTKGYASLDYEFGDYKASNLVKLDILLAGSPIDALSFIVHRDKAYERGRVLCEKLKAIIPHQLFEVPIQAAMGGRVLARQTVKAKRKDVLAKCYGGDISRKRKLLEKQKAGKKRMKSIGSVDVPQEAFMAILKVDE
jgi:GTP-binding protein LepA